ncbi:ABC-2 type transport system ATP-binding protein [Pseudonocardia hierapolitana]|uniref:ABC-2 type transport system ATP-binding protein n=1 Tax=Pseudonocardia hierapolitana TaxID=1128676 RepID=A0A561SUA3_9PSEU|nr:ATP-binding cassette domain-containing protein [Pseudonocardia hierapolitana]TWF78448.1 ABC-2 type transport system ATP-binding protein [Pseudonocardia hierapolitana]
MSAENIVETEGLRREFTVGRRRARRRVVAVSDVDLRIAPGEAVGFLGPNGAGKSTTIKMLTGILVPTTGRLRVCGLDPTRQRRELARRLGVVFGQRSQLWWDLPLRDSFELLGAIHRVPGPEHRARLERCVEVLELAPFLDVPVRQLSLGQRMRGEVTAALLHGPRLLVLDEPTVGLDLVSKERLRAFLQEVNVVDGMTILLTTHDLPDVERLCRRVVVIDQGRVVADDTIDALRARSGGAREVVVELTEPAAPLNGLSGVRDVRVEAGGLRQRLAFAPADTTAAALIAAVAARVELRDVTVVEPSIEDLVRTLYARR